MSKRKDQKISVDLLATDLTKYPDTSPFVTFYSKQDEDDVKKWHFTIDILAVVPYVITEDNIEFKEATSRIIPYDRENENREIDTREIIISLKKEENTGASDDPMNIYYIHISYHLLLESEEQLSDEEQRVFVYFQEIVPHGIPKTDRGTVVTTARPPIRQAT